MSKLEKDIFVIRRNYKRGFLSYTEAMKCFSQVCADFYGVDSEKYRELENTDFDSCFGY